MSNLKYEVVPLITRTIDHLGRVSMPIEMRERCGIDPLDKVVFRLEDGLISVKKVYINCVFCGAWQDKSGKTMLRFLHRKPYCTRCAQELAAELVNEKIQD